MFVRIFVRPSVRPYIRVSQFGLVLSYTAEIAQIQTNLTNSEPPIK